MERSVFAAPSREAGSHALVEVARRFRGRIEPLDVRRSTLLDTFDLRLLDAGSVLRCEDRTFSWEGLDGRLRHRLTVDRPPEFAWDLPAGAFREELAEIVDVRRLVPIAEHVAEGRRLRVLDGDDRAIALVELTWGSASVDGRNGPLELPSSVQVESLSEHAREHADLRALLEYELGFPHAVPQTLDALRAALEERRVRYASKFELDLDPAMPAGEAVRHILHELLGALRANEAGTRRDLDTEFLHDFRVASRRARTLLGQFHRVLDPDPVERLREDLAWLGEHTGPVRDLDVYLLELSAGPADLPAEVREALVPLVQLLLRRKEAARARLLEALDSERYAALVDGWAAIGATAAPPATGVAAPPPIVTVAAERIAKRFRRVLDRGWGIVPSSPPTDLHRLRIECKRLRYLLEFFRSVFPRDPLDRAVKALRRLQDDLGEYNDRQVQQSALERAAAELQEEGAEATTLIALGRIVERLAERQAEARGRFQKNFARFERHARPDRLEWLRRGSATA